MIDTMELVNDSTIISLKGTGMETYQTPLTESKYLELLMFDANEIPDQSEEESIMQSKIVNQFTETTSNVVEIRLKNAVNIERKIILTYTK